MLEHRFSAAELADYAQLSLATVSFFVKSGILKPSIDRARGRGRGHVFSYGDVLTAMTLNALRLPNAATGPLQQLVAFWGTERGRALVRELHRGGPRQEPRLLFITEKGVDVDGSPGKVMKERDAAVVYCLNATHFTKQLVIRATDSQVLYRFAEPGPFGRVPRKTSTTRSAIAKRSRRDVAPESASRKDHSARGGKKKGARRKA